jgi:hypothetical protein
MIEPNPYKCELGQLNLNLITLKGKVFNGCIGDFHEDKCVFSDWDNKVYDIERISIDWLMESQNLTKINIPSQPYSKMPEHQLLDGAQKLILGK